MPPPMRACGGASRRPAAAPCDRVRWKIGCETQTSSTDPACGASAPSSFLRNDGGARPLHVHGPGACPRPHGSSMSRDYVASMGAALPWPRASVFRASLPPPHFLLRAPLRFSVVTSDLIFGISAFSGIPPPSLLLHAPPSPPPSPLDALRAPLSLPRSHPPAAREPGDRGGPGARAHAPRRGARGGVGAGRAADRPRRPAGPVLVL